MCVFVSGIVCMYVVSWGDSRKARCITLLIWVKVFQPALSTNEACAQLPTHVRVLNKCYCAQNNIPTHTHTSPHTHTRLHTYIHTHRHNEIITLTHRQSQHTHSHRHTHNDTHTRTAAPWQCSQAQTRHCWCKTHGRACACGAQHDGPPGVLNRRASATRAG